MICWVYWTHIDDMLKLYRLTRQWKLGHGFMLRTEMCVSGDSALKKLAKQKGKNS